MILEDFSTKKDLDDLLTSIQRFKLDLFNFKAEDLEKHIHDNYDVVFANTLREIMSRGDIGFVEEDKLRLESSLDALEKDASSIEILEITVAFNPTQRFLSELKNWISKNIKENILIDLKVNESIVAGAEIVYQGNYRDFTISNKLRNYNFKL